MNRADYYTKQNYRDMEAEVFLENLVNSIADYNNELGIPPMSDELAKTEVGKMYLKAYNEALDFLMRRNETQSLS